MSKKRTTKVKGGAASAASPTDNTAGESGADAAQPELTLEEKLVEQVHHWKEYAARAQAEFENTRKRLEARAMDDSRRAGLRMVEATIPALDDLEYAMAHATESSNEMADGITAIHAKLISALEREGVEVIDPLGQPFDHETAQAVQMVEDDSVADQTVSNVLQKGYRMAGKVVRPAMVVVATGGPTAE